MTLDEALAALLGEFEVYDDIFTKSRFIRSRGKTMKISHEDLMMDSRQSLYFKIIKFFTEDEIQQLRAGTHTANSRIAEIDAELDILRGVVPTPRGYTFDINRVKVLMKERKELTK